MNAGFMLVDDHLRGLWSNDPNDPAIRARNLDILGSEYEEFDDSDEIPDWVAIQADELAREYPSCDWIALAEDLEKHTDTYDEGPEAALAIAAECRDRAAKGVPTFLETYREKLRTVETAVLLQLHKRHGPITLPDSCHGKREQAVLDEAARRGIVLDD